MTAGLKTIISLSFVRQPNLRGLESSTFISLSFPLSPPHRANLKEQVLAIGFLLVILSCALFKQYLPLLVVATYVLAPFPNWVCSRCANPDDFMEPGSSNAVIDFGRFCTGFLVVMGIALPAILAHSEIIRIPAMIMSIVGGLLIYGTIISFGMFFQEEQEF
jgi:hypothetical protein